MTDDTDLGEVEDRDNALLQKHVAELAEHFETVQIFVTREMTGELDGTISARRGAGNWFARYGCVREWVVQQEAQMRIDQRRHSDGEDE